MDYILIQFTKGLSCQAYQEVSDGNIVRFCDLDGNTLTLPAVTESDTVKTPYARPSWGV